MDVDDDTGGRGLQQCAGKAEIGAEEQIDAADGSDAMVGDGLTAEENGGEGNADVGEQ